MNNLIKDKIEPQLSDKNILESIQSYRTLACSLVDTLK